MFKNVLVLDDGTEITAGTAGKSAILSLTCTETISKTTDLCPGAACANKLEITIWVEPGTDLVITSGTRLKHYREVSGQRTLAGTYWAVKPTKQTRNTYKIYAYDAVSRLDGIQSSWLRSIQNQFPMTLWAFAQLAAQRCGVTIANSALPRSGDYQVQAFYADNLTGRQLLAWAAEASCTFLRATPDGKIEFAWYTDYAAQGIGPGNPSQQWMALNFAGLLFAVADGSIWTFAQPQAAYYQGGLSYEAYQTAAIDKVQLKQSDDDVGVIYPPDATGTNALVIEGNMLLAPTSAASLSPIAQAIYERMQGVSYTPLKVSIPLSAAVPEPGSILAVTDAYGRTMQTCVMSRTISGQKATLESTGNARRDGTAAVNEQKYTNLQGRLLEISASVDGLNIKASELSGQYTQLSQTVDSISLTAENGGNTSKLTLSANGIALSSADITFSGMVTFTDLSTWNQDKTIINGGNITTGQIHNLNYSTVYDLDGAWIRMGTEAGERVFLDNRHIAWYATINTGSIGLTGVLYSEAGSSYIGACSKYAKYGWVDGLNPTSYVGLQITYNRSDDSDADFNTTRVGVSGTLNCQNLSAWGSKSRVVSTSFGALKMAAFETPTPTFADWGRAECNADGWCVIVPDPRYAETIAQHGQLTWLLTDCTGSGHLWAEDCGQYAIVHGAAGQRFAWLCMAAQRGYEGDYAERSDSSYPAGTPAGVELAASTAARALDAGENAADDLLTMDTGAKQAVDTLLEDLEGNET